MPGRAGQGGTGRDPGPGDPVHEEVQHQTPRLTRPAACQCSSSSPLPGLGGGRGEELGLVKCEGRQQGDGDRKDMSRGGEAWMM